MPDWWESFFDADYLRLWEAAEAPDKTTARPPACGRCSA